MIPVDGNEPVKIKDEKDNIMYTIRPVVGGNEYELQTLLKKINEVPDNDSHAVTKIYDEIFDKFVIGWSSTQEGVPSFPADNKPSKFFRLKDKTNFVITKLLGQESSLQEEEKKS